MEGLGRLPVGVVVLALLGLRRSWPPRTCVCVRACVRMCECLCVCVCDAVLVLLGLAALCGCMRVGNAELFDGQLGTSVRCCVQTARSQAA